MATLLPNESSALVELRMDMEEGVTKTQYSCFSGARLRGFINAHLIMNFVLVFGQWRVVSKESMTISISIRILKVPSSPT